MDDGDWHRTRARQVRLEQCLPVLLLGMARLRCWRLGIAARED